MKLMDKDIEFNFSYPEEISCFVLPGTILLPRSKTPLNITEPWAITMVDDALRNNRLLGLVQPQSEHKTAEGERLYSSGTLGRITTFIEQSNKHYFIMLSGLCRFDVLQKLEAHKDACRLKVNYHRYTFDLFEEEVLAKDREKLIGLMKNYLSSHQIHTNFEEFEDVSDNDLMTSLTMLCPFNTQEKQALLESPSAQNRCEMLMAFMERNYNREEGRGLTLH